MMNTRIPTIILGYLLVTAGFLWGALASVMDIEHVRWPWFGYAMVVGAFGVVMIRLSEHQKSRSSTAVSANMQVVHDSLQRIVNNIGVLNNEKTSIHTYDIRHRIDELFPDDLRQFVEAREAIAHAYSLQAYAEVMSHFAAAERYLNRVWSASADGYIDEVYDYLDKSRDQFCASLQKIEHLRQS